MTNRTCRLAMCRFRKTNRGPVSCGWCTSGYAVLERPRCRRFCFRHVEFGSCQLSQPDSTVFPLARLTQGCKLPAGIRVGSAPGSNHAVPATASCQRLLNITPLSARGSVRTASAVVVCGPSHGARPGFQGSVGTPLGLGRALCRRKSNHSEGPCMARATLCLEVPAAASTA